MGSSGKGVFKSGKRDTWQRGAVPRGFVKVERNAACGSCGKEDKVTRGRN